MKKAVTLIFSILILASTSATLASCPLNKGRHVATAAKSQKKKTTLRGPQPHRKVRKSK